MLTTQLCKVPAMFWKMIGFRLPSGPHSLNCSCAAEPAVPHVMPQISQIQSQIMLFGNTFDGYSLYIRKEFKHRLQKSLSFIKTKTHVIEQLVFFHSDHSSNKYLVHIWPLWLRSVQSMNNLILRFKHLI